MDQTALVNDLADRGGRLLDAFSRTEWGPLRAAFWRREDGREDGVWRLYLVPHSATEETILDIYRVVDQLEADMEEPQLPRFTADVALPTEPLAAAMMSRPVQGPKPRWIDPATWELAGEEPILAYPLPQPGEARAAA